MPSLSTPSILKPVGREPERVFPLLQKTYDFFVAHWKIFVPLALIGALLSAAGQSALLYTMQKIPLASLPEGTPFKEVAVVLMDHLPLLLLVAVVQIVAWLLLSIITTSYLSIALEETKSAQSALQRGFSLFIPVAVVYFFAGLRAGGPLLVAALIMFAAVMFDVGSAVQMVAGLLMAAGVVYALLMGPRTWAAPVIYLREGKGLWQSVQESVRRTNGYWGKIVGNSIVFGIIMFVIGICVAILAGILGAMVDAMGPTVAVAFKTLFTSFMNLFLSGASVTFQVLLAVTILDHPRVASAK